MISLLPMMTSKKGGVNFAGKSLLNSKKVNTYKIISEQDINFKLCQNASDKMGDTLQKKRVLSLRSSLFFN